MFEKRPHLPELESIRGIMAWWVVFGHLYSFFYGSLHWLPSIVSKFFLATAFPVDIFIALSGFVICGSLLASPKKSFYSYLSRRFFRIYPLYIVAFLLAVLLFGVRVTARTQAGWLMPDQVSGYSGYSSNMYEHWYSYLVAGVTLLQGVIPNVVLPNAGDAFISPAWSLSLEWQFYLVAPLLVMAIRSYAAICVILFISVLVNSYFNRHDIYFSYGSFLPVKISFFLLGMLSAKIYFLNDEGRRARQAKTLLCMLAAVGCVYGSGGNTTSLAAACSWLLVVLVLINKHRFHAVDRLVSRCRRSLSSGFFMALGKMSFSTYMLHILVIDLIAYFYVRIGFSIFGSLLVDVPFLIILSIICIFLASIVAHRFIEVPGMNIKKTLGQS